MLVQTPCFYVKLLAAGWAQDKDRGDQEATRVKQSKQQNIHPNGVKAMPGLEHHPRGHSPAPAPVPKPLTHHWQWLQSRGSPGISFAVWGSSLAAQGAPRFQLFGPDLQGADPSSSLSESWGLGWVPLVPPACPGCSLGSSPVLPSPPQQLGLGSTRR